MGNAPPLPRDGDQSTNAGSLPAAERSAAELAKLYRDGKASPVEVLEECLRKIEERDAHLNAFCLVDRERALVEARASEARFRDGYPLGPLDGVPIAVKDLLLTTGWPTLRGSRAVEPDQPWSDDAPSVSQTRKAGAVHVGKTTTPEFGWKSVTDSDLVGITRNPYDPTRTAGGSSGGSAAAVAARMVPLAFGTDGGGSIRIPASFCGVVGLKPTFGRVPLWPPSPFGSLAVVGPMARTVDDAALMLQAMSGTDRRDWTQLPPPAELGAGAPREDLAGISIAILAIKDSATPDVRAAFDAALRLLESLGARTEVVALDLSETKAVFEALWSVGCARIVADVDAQKRYLLDPGLLAMAEAGAAVPAVDYLAFERERGLLATKLHEIHSRFDVLVSPTTPIVAFSAGGDVPRDSGYRRWTDWTPYTYPFNLSQQPALSLPCAVDPAGLPIGLQLVGPKYSEHMLLAVGRVFEHARGPLRGPSFDLGGASQGHA
jgi:aspartyl-tRNA(Asn)/glutamyl-tRNA(Gln) amidotransferase subunit A